MILKKLKQKRIEKLNAEFNQPRVYIYISGGVLKRVIFWNHDDWRKKFDKDGGIESAHALELERFSWRWDDWGWGYIHNCSEYEVSLSYMGMISGISEAIVEYYSLENSLPAHPELGLDFSSDFMVSYKMQKERVENLRKEINKTCHELFLRIEREYLSANGATDPADYFDNRITKAKEHLESSKQLLKAFDEID